MTAPGRSDASSKFAITVAFELDASGVDEFHRLVCENAAHSISLEPDCLRFDVLRPTESAQSSILLYEVYVDRAAFDWHLETAHYRAFDAKSRHLVLSKTVTTFAVSDNSKDRRVGDDPQPAT